MCGARARLRLLNQALKEKALCLFLGEMERSYGLTVLGRGGERRGAPFFSLHSRTYRCVRPVYVASRETLSFGAQRPDPESYRGWLTRNARDTPLYTRRRDAASLNYTQQRCAGVRGDLGLYFGG